MKKIMAAGIAVKYVAPIRQYVDLDIRQFTPFRNLLLGAGLAYALSEDKYYHVPLTIIFPSVYVGYHTYKNRDTVAKFVQEKLK